MAPKRSRISESESPEGADDHKQLSQNSTLPAAPQPQEKQIMSLGLPTSDPTKRSSPPPFGKFLEACRWCKKKLIEDIYMYGFLGAFCSPECRENLIKVDKYFEDHFSKSSSADRGTKRVKET